MAIGIDELFEMLNWNSDEQTQKKGIEEGMKVRCFSVFLQPIEDKGVWENCAKIIAKKSNNQLEPYLSFLLEWLQDENWPGFDIIYNRLVKVPVQFIRSSYSYIIKKAQGLKDEMWLIYLSRLAIDSDLCKYLTFEQKEIIKKYSSLDVGRY